MRHFFLLFLLFSLSACLTAQVIWPGDVNNNGEVNGVDLLYWGIANGTNGPARGSISVDWISQIAPADWPQSFSNGINYAYADCNGDGQINDDDFDDAIADNFGLTHGSLLTNGYANASPGSAAPRLEMRPSMDVAEEGAIIDISLVFAEDGQQPLPDFYGLALHLSYTTGLLEGDDGPDFDLVENEWLDGVDGAVQEIFVDDNGMGTAQLAVTRTNQLTVAVQPTAIGNFSIVIEDIIVGLTIDTFELVIDSVLFIGAELQTVAVVPDTVQIIIAKDASTISTSSSAGPAVGGNPAEVQKQEQIKLYPNPASRLVYLETETTLQRLQLVDQLGHRFALTYQLRPDNTYVIPIPIGLVSGIYWLNGYTSRSQFSHKVWLSP